MNENVILLVDDEEHILNALRRLFRKEGYELVATTDPLEALDIIKKREIDVIISDQRMPKMTGSELLAAARDARPDTIRIMLTGYTDLQSAEDAINRGEVWRFLVKPWNDQDLRNTVRQAAILIEMRKAQRRMFSRIRTQNTELARLNYQQKETLDVKDKKLEEFNAQIHQMDKLSSLGLMAGGVAHELNNPLAGILAMTQLLIEEKKGDRGLCLDLKEIERAVLHSRDVVLNLLSFARQGKESNLEEIDPKDIVGSVLALIKHSLEMKDITVEVDLGNDVPTIWGHKNRLQQVLINLLTNAAQATQAGGLIQLKSNSVDDGEKICIEVIDHGIGIPPEHLGKIFDPFFTTKDEGQGTGLGLSVSYGIVKDHRGEISVTSEPGVGSRFSVILPAYNREKTENNDKENRTPATDEAVTTSVENRQ